MGLAAEGTFRPEESAQQRRARLENVVVAALLLLSAALLYRAFWPQADALWYTTLHDRNGHYTRSLRFALALREGSPIALLKEIHGATVWPPLHPLLTGMVLAPALDYRLAVLTSLAGWVATCWFAFALARRLATRHKELAGGVALLLTVASPAHRAFATDIMIESLGAALTLASLYFYVSARQERSAGRATCFALFMLALFLTKFNYWTLLAFGLLLAALWEFRGAVRAALAAHWRAGIAFLVAQLRHPLTYPLALAVALCLYVKFVGGLTLSLAGTPLTIGSLDFPAELAFVLLLVRVFPWWRRQGRRAVNNLPVPARELVRWHVYPLCLWFLWPRRLSAFLWYVTVHHPGDAIVPSPLFGWAGYYAGCLAHDYHANRACLILVGALVALAVACWRRRAPGSSTVLICLGAAALLTNYHSACRSRFLLSWLPIAWVAAGVGAAAALDWLASRFQQGREAKAARRAPLLRLAAVGGALAGLAWLQGKALLQQGHSEEGGPSSTAASLLPLADVAVSDLAEARRPVLLAPVGFDLLLNWRLSEHAGRDRRLLVPPGELLGAGLPGPFNAWQQRVACDRVLLIDAPGVPDLLNPVPFKAARVRTLLTCSGQFSLASEQHLTAPIPVTLQVWRRSEVRSARLQLRQR